MTKLNIGCGGNILEGFQNHDLDVDICKPLPWENDSVDFILAEHVFEHVPGPDAFRFLKECRRILKPGGVLRLCVPVIDRERGLTKAAKEDLIVNHGHLCAYTEELLIELVSVAGFIASNVTKRKDCDGHHRVIGVEKDDLETFRLEATK